MKFPRLYEGGIKHALFTWPMFFRDIAKGILHGLVLYCTIAFSFFNGGGYDSDGQDIGDSRSLSTAIGWSCILITHFQIIVIVQHWTILHGMCLALYYYY